MSIMQMYALDPNGIWKPVISGVNGSLAEDPPSKPWVYTAASSGITDTSDVTLVAAAGTDEQGNGKANYLTDLQVINGSTGAATEVVVKDGSTVIWREYFDAGAGISVRFQTPLYSSPNTALKAAAITTSGKVYINAQGYQDANPVTLLASSTFKDELIDDLGALITDDNGATIYAN